MSWRARVDGDVYGPVGGSAVYIYNACAEKKIFFVGDEKFFLSVMKIFLSVTRDENFFLSVMMSDDEWRHKNFFCRRWVTSWKFFLWCEKKNFFIGDEKSVVEHADQVGTILHSGSKKSINFEVWKKVSTYLPFCQVSFSTVPDEPIIKVHFRGFRRYSGPPKIYV